MPATSGARVLRASWTGRWARRWVLGLVAAGLAVAGLTVAARAEVNVGLRFGWSDVSAEVFTGSGDLGGTHLMGAHLGFELGSVLGIEVAGESISKEFDFSEGLIGGVEAVGDGKWEDLALYCSGRVRVMGLGFVPVYGYGGGGLNIHWADLALENVTPSSADAGPGALEDEIKEIAGERSELGWHVLAGVRLVPGNSPLSIFAEARHMKGFDTNRIPASNSIYVGASIRL